MRYAFSCTLFLKKRVIWHSFFFISPIMGSETHRRSQVEHRQGSEVGHAHLKTSSICSCFMLWEVVNQTENCCSFKVKIVAPPKRLAVMSLLEPPCDVKFLQKLPISPIFWKSLVHENPYRLMLWIALLSTAIFGKLWSKGNFIVLVQQINATMANPAKKTDGDCYLDSPFVKCAVLATIFCNW